MYMGTKNFKRLFLWNCQTNAVMNITDTPGDSIQRSYTECRFFCSAWLCQQGSWYMGILSAIHRPSVVRHPGRPSSVLKLSQNLLGGFLSNFSCWLPRAIRPDFVFNFWKKKTCFPIFQDLFINSFSITWNPRRAKTSKRCSSLKSLLNFFKILAKFVPSGPYKSTVFEFFEFTIFHEDFSLSLTWDPMGAKTSKR